MIFDFSGYRIPRFKAPYIGLWLYSLFDSEARQALNLYRHEEYFDNSKVRYTLHAVNLCLYVIVIEFE